ncbi:hypothetical protein ACLIKD_09545 [Azonexus sp. IMCC34842]|uniref:hypothetical protein n=1 Tax=Azonexus sp. IMCC34842 TaxID=3420950 RepID=UPI003D09B902
MTQADFTPLNAAGLNLQAIFNIADLPAELAGEIHQRFDPENRYRQLILIGHGGKRLWAALKDSGIASENPIDDFSSATVRQWLATHPHTIIYPARDSLGLQALGKLAGWHHASPFMVGINETWGSWYAYRVVALSDTDFAPSIRQTTTSPCTQCRDQPCLASCPAGALSGDAFDLNKCIAYRKQPASACRATCLARVSCPVGTEHRYCDAQIAHTYTISMRMIEALY